MESLQHKEREVLREEIQRGIMEKVQQEFGDQFDKEVARIRAQLQQDIREEIRAEYDDLAAHLTQSPQRDEEEIERQRMEVQQQFEERLSAEKRTLAEQQERMETALKAQIADLNEGNGTLKNENTAMQREVDSLRRRGEAQGSELESARKEVEKVMDSKLQLIEATSMEIDSLRHRIKMYTMGDWGGVISNGGGHRNGF